MLVESLAVIPIGTYRQYAWQLLSAHRGGHAAVMKDIDKFPRWIILFVSDSQTLLILKSTSPHLKYTRISQMQRLILCN